MSKRILVVDDEVRIREVVQYGLEKNGFLVEVAQDGRTALARLAQGGFDLVVLDVMLPDLDGYELCRRIRAEGHLPILFLSARSEEVDRIVGLELGADDYLTKPFSPRELVARVRAILRRFEAAGAKETRSRSLDHGRLHIDLERHEVRFDDQLVELTATELTVLAALVERPGIVLSRAQLVERAYDGGTHVTERTMDSHVRRIRAKFRAVGGDPIATVHGVGYKAAE
ncbi:MAG: response regulator transcription factor [Polyangiaceae bacterium]|nr:response regulator transcription factor [Polyangiaceae bacterium]